MHELEVFLLVAIGAIGLLLIILLHKITILKKQTDDIIKEVKAYVAYVTEQTEEEIAPQSVQNQSHTASLYGKIPQNISKEEAQNHIIQAVLGEYFP